MTPEAAVSSCMVTIEKPGSSLQSHISTAKILLFGWTFWTAIIWFLFSQLVAFLIDLSAIHTSPAQEKIYKFLMSFDDQKR